MKREIINTVATCVGDIDMAGFVDKPLQWLSQKMYAHSLNYLLAHADDGVIWGRLDGEELITSHTVAPEYSPPLREATLQTVRLFARVGELFICRDEDGEWASRLIVEATSPGSMTEWTSAFDERQVLWGTHAVSRERGFVLVSDG